MMQTLRPTSARLALRKTRQRSIRPGAEALEGRILLYSAFGQWTYSSRITYSFEPDGTNIAGTPSVLFQTLNASYPVTQWQNQIEQAATIWEASAHVNLAQVSDGGQPFGTYGDQQDDPRFGDIRIGMIPLPPGVLAETILPPPTNGGTAAGDILFNSTIRWQIGTGYDLETVAAHEFGHALGLGESSDPNSVMYGVYNGIKTALDSDDIAGIQSLYGAPQYDQFGGNNHSVFTPTNLISYLSPGGQVALSGLDNTYATQSEWYSITVPSTNSGQMVVTVQSSNLSSLSPALYIYNSSLGVVAQAGVGNTYGATISTSNAVTAGQKYYIKVMSGGSYGRVGTYGLQVNFTTQPMPPIQPPNTVVPQQLNQVAAAGSTTNAVMATSGDSAGAIGIGIARLQNAGAAWTGVGDIDGWVVPMMASATAFAPVSVPVSPPAVPVQPSLPTAVAGPISPLTSSPATATTVTVASPASDAQAAPLSGSEGATPSAHRRHKVVHHAVDAALAGWKGHRKRPLASSKVRTTTHEHEPIA
jgi:hypothetical protein